MKNNKLSVLFLLQKNRLNQQEECPIRCRITYYKKRKEFSTGIFINPDYWDSKKQIATIPNDENYLKNQLSLIKQKVNQAFLFLQVNETTYDVDDIYFVVALLLYRKKNYAKVECLFLSFIAQIF